jgi:hypothetical protein
MMHGSIPSGMHTKRDSSHVYEVDIDQPFGLLPPSWQHENLLQARSALEVVRDYPDLELDDWAAIVYEQWLDRRRAETIPAGTAESAASEIVTSTPAALPEWIVEQGLDLPFAELSMLEQEKDRVVVRVAMLLRTDAPLPHVASLSPASPTQYTSTIPFPGHKRDVLASSVIDVDDDVFGDDDVDIVDDKNADNASDALHFVQQPLQAAISRFLRIKLSLSKQSNNKSISSRDDYLGIDNTGRCDQDDSKTADDTFGESPVLFRASSSDGLYVKSYPDCFDPRDSCLNDPTVAMLLDADAAPISAVVNIIYVLYSFIQSFA